MNAEPALAALKDRVAPIEMSPDDFRAAGHEMVDAIAEFMKSLPDRPVSPGESPAAVRDLLGVGSIPEEGSDPVQLLSETTRLLFDHSTFNGHPRFLAYITSSAAPIGALADLLAAAVNPNVGGWNLSPTASEIEAQSVRWIAELIGYPADCGGLLVSGGNAANFVGFLAARRAKLGESVRSKGIRHSGGGQPVAYCSAETHTWIEKAADQYGIGTEAIRWVRTDENLRMDMGALRTLIEEDEASGNVPFIVVGTAGSTAVGAIDPLPDIAAICREHDLWFHVDGAYGAVAAALPDSPTDLQGLSEADSVAIDPHKWMYSALEAGCILVRDPQILIDTFSYHPTYYKFEEATEEAPINFYEHGPQNSRGFRALKVWLGIRQVGRQGHLQMIAEDIQLAERLYRLVDEHTELEPFTQNLSITTFRFVPEDLREAEEESEDYLNQLNEKLLSELREGGEAFISNALIDDTYLLRSCIVNFRTALGDIESLPEIITRLGREVDARLRPDRLK